VEREGRGREREERDTREERRGATSKYYPNVRMICFGRKRRERNRRKKDGFASEQDIRRSSTRKGKGKKMKKRELFTGKGRE